MIKLAIITLKNNDYLENNKSKYPTNKNRLQSFNKSPLKLNHWNIKNHTSFSKC